MAILLKHVMTAKKFCQSKLWSKFFEHYVTVEVDNQTSVRSTKVDFQSTESSTEIVKNRSEFSKLQTNGQDWGNLAPINSYG